MKYQKKEEVTMKSEILKKTVLFLLNGLYLPTLVVII